MLLNTSRFGEIEINEKDIITFGEGLPGFELFEKYIVTKGGDEGFPFSWLQSVENPDLAFLIINPLYFKGDYDIVIDDLSVNSLGLEAVEDVQIYSIVVVPEDISKISANLKAPLIINMKNRKAKQVILDTNEYHVRHYILEELQNQGV